jgi:hypothetical protein
VSVGRGVEASHRTAARRQKAGQSQAQRRPAAHAPSASSRLSRGGSGGGADARSSASHLGVLARSSVVSVALAAPALARGNLSTAEWLSESCESAPSRWSLLDPRVLVREQLTKQSRFQCVCKRKRQSNACKATLHSGHSTLRPLQRTVPAN